MTYTKLIERMRTDPIFDNTTLGNEAADAIEALQKEVSALDVLLEECKMDWSGDVTQLKAEHKHEIEALQSKLGDAIQSSAHWQHQFTELQAENERLKRELEISKMDTKEWHSQADTLQARLDAMDKGKGEPVAWSITVGDEFKNCVEITHNEADTEGRLSQLSQGGFGSLYTLHKLYAAPKALAPTTWQNQFTEAQAEIGRLKEEREKDAFRLVWSMNWMRMSVHDHGFTKHVLERGGIGDYSDCATYIDKCAGATQEAALGSEGTP